MFIYLDLEYVLTANDKLCMCLYKLFTKPFNHAVALSKNFYANKLAYIFQ